MRLDRVLSDDALLDAVGTAPLLPAAEPHRSEATRDEDVLLAGALLDWRRHLES